MCADATAVIGCSCTRSGQMRGFAQSVHGRIKVGRRLRRYLISIAVGYQGRKCDLGAKLVAGRGIIKNWLPAGAGSGRARKREPSTAGSAKKIALILITGPVHHGRLI